MDRLTQLDLIAQDPTRPMADRAAAIREFSKLMGFGPEEYDDGTPDDQLVAEWCE